MSTQQIVNGAISYQNNPGRLDCLFRVSLKAVIFNNDGHVLVVKESGRDWWDIPGGGIDHGESIVDGLARELYEEVSMTGTFVYETILIDDPCYLENHNLYQTRITFMVKPDVFSFEPGDDADEISFIDPMTFKDSPLATERRIYEYSQVAINRSTPVKS